MTQLNNDASSKARTHKCSSCGQSGHNKTTCQRRTTSDPDPDSPPVTSEKNKKNYQEQRIHEDEVVKQKKKSETNVFKSLMKGLRKAFSKICICNSSQKPSPSSPSNVHTPSSSSKPEDEKIKVKPHKEIHLTAPNDNIDKQPLSPKSPKKNKEIHLSVPKDDIDSQQLSPKSPKKCSICNLPNHNKRTCPQRVQEPIIDTQDIDTKEVKEYNAKKQEKKVQVVKQVVKSPAPKEQSNSVSNSNNDTKTSCHASTLSERAACDPKTSPNKRDNLGRVACTEGLEGWSAWILAVEYRQAPDVPGVYQYALGKTKNDIVYIGGNPKDGTIRQRLTQHCARPGNYQIDKLIELCIQEGTCIYVRWRERSWYHSSIGTERHEEAWEMNEFKLHHGGALPRCNQREEGLGPGLIIPFQVCHKQYQSIESSHKDSAVKSSLHSTRIAQAAGI